MSLQTELFEINFIVQNNLPWIAIFYDYSFSMKITSKFSLVLAEDHNFERASQYRIHYRIDNRVVSQVNNYLLANCVRYLCSI